VVERQVLNPYGKAKSYTANFQPKWSTSFGWNIAHQGGRVDAGTNLTHFRHRWLHTTLGRWTSRDPMGYVDGASLFGYVKHNPTTLRDQSGLVVETKDWGPEDAFVHWKNGTAEDVHIWGDAFKDNIRNSNDYKSYLDNTVYPGINGLACGKCRNLRAGESDEFQAEYRTRGLTMPGWRWAGFGTYEQRVAVNGHVWKDKNCKCTYSVNINSYGRDTYHDFKKPGFEENFVSPLMQTVAFVSNYYDEIYTLSFAERGWFGASYRIGWALKKEVMRVQC
jgi:RHS repeat-associated protein